MTAVVVAMVGLFRLLRRSGGDADRHREVVRSDRSIIGLLTAGALAQVIGALLSWVLQPMVEPAEPETPPAVCLSPWWRRRWG